MIFVTEAGYSFSFSLYFISTLPVEASISTAAFALISTGVPVSPAANAHDNSEKVIIAAKVNANAAFMIFFISVSPFEIL